jgi:F0F1-type ATP synthase assembly protein I
MARTPSDPRTPTLSIVQALAVASQFGITLVVAVVLGYLAGQWLDSHLNSGIVFTLLGVLLGLAGTAVSFVNLYRATMRRVAREHATREDQRETGDADTTCCTG